MKQLLFCIISLITISFTVFSQNDFGVKINGGISYLSTKVESTPPTKQKFYVMPSGQAGLFYNLHPHDKFLFGTEVFFSQIEGKELLKSEEIDQNGPTGQYATDYIWRHISYVGMPIYIGYSFKWFKINLGIQANLTLLSGGRDKGQATENGTIYTYENKYDHLAIDYYDYGVRAGMLFKLSNKFSIDVNYYYGLNNIVQEAFLSNYWTWKVQQATVGIRYKFNGRKKEK